MADQWVDVVFMQGDDYTEVADLGIHWMEPRDVEDEKLNLGINHPSRQGIHSDHRGGFNALFADASVHFIASDRISLDEFKAMFTPAGGEPLPNANPPPATRPASPPSTAPS